MRKRTCKRGQKISLYQNLQNWRADIPVGSVVEQFLFGLDEVPCLSQTKMESTDKCVETLISRSRSQTNSHKTFGLKSDFEVAGNECSVRWHKAVAEAQASRAAERWLPRSEARRPAKPDLQVLR